MAERTDWLTNTEGKVEMGKGAQQAGKSLAFLAAQLNKFPQRKALGK